MSERCALRHALSCTVPTKQTSTCVTLVHSFSTISMRGRGDAHTHHAVCAVWSLGVIAFEAISNERALLGQAAVMACALGSQPYPWELPVDQQPKAWRNSRLARLVAPALARDAAARPSAAEIYQAVSRVGQATSISGDSSAP